MATTDKYANVLFDSVTESAANTLTFESVDVGLSIFDKVGLLISRLEYSGWQQQLADDTDSIEFGLAQSNQFTDPDPSEPSVIDYVKFNITEIGVAANALVFMNPYIKDFSTLPGGGMLIVPKPLYMYAKGANLGGAATIKMRAFFTIVKLQPAEYFELLESRQFFG